MYQYALTQVRHCSDGHKGDEWRSGRTLRFTQEKVYMKSTSFGVTDAIGTGSDIRS